MGQPAGLEKPQHIISVEIGAEQPVGREGERKDMSFSPLPSRELGGSHAHVMGMCCECRFQEPCHGGNPMGPARKL